MYLDCIPDPTPNNAIMFQMSTAEVNLLPFLQWLAQRGLLGVQDDAIALCAG